MRDKVWAAFGNLNVHVILLYYFLFSFVLGCSPLLSTPRLGRNLVPNAQRVLKAISTFMQIVVMFDIILPYVSFSSVHRSTDKLNVHALIFASSPRIRVTIFFLSLPWAITLLQYLSSHSVGHGS
jgi:hypothetical protein